MRDQVVLLIRFHGDPDDLHDRFEAARSAWADARPAIVEPALYAACKTDAGIVIVIGWRTGADHKAFRQGIRRHLAATGIGRPDAVERLLIAKLGWHGAAAAEI